VFRVFLILATALALSSCVTWRTYESGQLAPDHSLPYRLRATRADSSRIAMTAPCVRGDTLYGRVKGDTVGVALATITRLERERVSAGKTALLVVGVPAAGFAALALTYFIVCGSEGCQPDYTLAF
jgi:hypothetical protein